MNRFKYLPFHIPIYIIYINIEIFAKIASMLWRKVTSKCLKDTRKTPVEELMFSMKLYKMSIRLPGSFFHKDTG